MKKLIKMLIQNSEADAVTDPSVSIALELLRKELEVCKKSLDFIEDNLALKGFELEEGFIGSNQICVLPEVAEHLDKVVKAIAELHETSTAFLPQGETDAL